MIPLLLDNLYSLLRQEGHITHSCITSGLTELRNANIGDSIGKYYRGFFQISIGLERMLKLALLLHQIVDCKGRPKQDIKQLGHNLKELYSIVDELVNTKGINRNEGLSDSPYKERLLDFFTNFASGARYANLDALNSKEKFVEPLLKWKGILDSIIDNEISEKTKSRIKQKSEYFYYLMRQRVGVVSYDLDSSQLSVYDYFIRPPLLTEAAKHIIWHLILLIYPVKQLISTFSYQNNNKFEIPYMEEFYDFLYLDRNYNFRKTRWV